MSVRVCVCSLLRYRLNVFCPHIPMSDVQIFRDSESLGKSNGKKCSQILTFLFASGLKSPRKKSLFFCGFCRTKHVENHPSRWMRDLWTKGIPLILAYLKTFLSFLRFGWFFPFFNKNWVLGYSWSTLLWHWCYYPHRSRDALSPVCGIFFFF